MKKLFFILLAILLSSTCFAAKQSINYSSKTSWGEEALKIQSNFNELYGYFYNSINISCSVPLICNSTTGVFSLSSSGLSSGQTWVWDGYSFVAGTASGGITVSSYLPTTPGTSFLNDSTHVLTVASNTGYTQFNGSFTAWDTTPNAFTFTDETGVALSTSKTSNAVTVSGINFPSAISVTGDTGYGYSKNGSSCTVAAGTVVDGDTVAACVTSSGSNSTATESTVTIGGVSDTYNITTLSGVTYIVNETFTSGSAPSGWTAADATKIYNYTPAIEGSYSLEIIGNVSVYTPINAAMLDYTVNLKFKALTLPTSSGNMLRFSVNGSDSNHVCNIYSTGAMALIMNGVSTYLPTGTIVAGNTYELNIHFISGAGNGIATLKVRNTSGTTWVSTTTSATINSNYGVTKTVLRGSDSGGYIVYDEIQVY